MKKILFAMLFNALFFTPLHLAVGQNNDPGQVIHISTYFRSFVGKPSWLLIIRDLDHNQNRPYLFDIRKGENSWTIFTFSKNYLITVSSMQFSPYKRYHPRFRQTNNFCHLESRGQIMKNLSLSLIIQGDLSPNTGKYTCQTTYYKD